MPPILSTANRAMLDKLVIEQARRRRKRYAPHQPQPQGGVYTGPFPLGRRIRNY